MNRKGNHTSDTTGWDPVITHADGTAFQSSAGFADTQGAHGWRYACTGSQAAATRPVLYAVGHDLSLRKETLDPATAFPFVILSDGHAEDGFGGYVMALDTDAPWTLDRKPDSVGLVAPDAPAVIIRYTARGSRV